MNNKGIIGSPLSVTTKKRGEILKLEVKFERIQRQSTVPLFKEKSVIKR
jgi:hypothetical protein